MSLHIGVEGGVCSEPEELDDQQRYQEAYERAAIWLSWSRRNTRLLLRIIIVLASVPGVLLFPSVPRILSGGCLGAVVSRDANVKVLMLHVDAEVLQLDEAHLEND